MRSIVNSHRRFRTPRVTLADAVLASGQRLRAGEAAGWATFLVAFAAQRLGR